MTVLTKKIKQSVLEAAVKFATAEGKAALSAALIAFADKCYEALCAEDAVKIRSLSQWGWVSYSRIFKVAGPVFSSSYNVSKRVPNSFLTLSEDPPISMLETVLTDREPGKGLRTA